MSIHDKKVVLLDLDGTLIESHYGILECAILTFQELHIPVPSDEELNEFIGPGIAESFRRHHIDEVQIPHAVEIYRHFYNDINSCTDPYDIDKKVPGKLACKLYDGVLDTLHILYNSGKYQLALATCKPENSARFICNHFGLTEYLHGMYGASCDNSRTQKDQVIQYAVQSLQTELSKQHVLMVGDRYTDTQGATKCNIDCLGCAWGYAQDNELLDTGAYRVINDIKELPQALDSYFSITDQVK